jgi:pantetheine-phosphate adenylyltransferase
MKKIAIYPGSFDPITNGHVDLIKRASKIFDEVIIAITQNANKSSFLSIDQRVGAVESSGDISPFVPAQVKTILLNTLQK